MKIKIQKRESLIAGKESEFASVCDAKTISQKDIALQIENEVGIPAIRSMSVFEAFATIVRKNIAEGNIVEIDGIGRIRVSVTIKENKPVIGKLLIAPNKLLKGDLTNVNFEIEQD